MGRSKVQSRLPVVLIEHREPFEQFETSEGRPSVVQLDHYPRHSWQPARPRGSLDCPASVLARPGVMKDPAAARVMYAPSFFAAADPFSIVNKYPFAHLITAANGETYATPTPVFFETDDTRATLVGHLTRINPHAQALQSGQPVLVVFSGPHTYISASWYKTLLTVPTWDYIAAQVRGRLEVIDDDAGQIKVLRRVAEVLERDSEHPWTLEQAPPGKVQELLPRIRSFRICVERIEGVTKLNQPHPPSDRLLIIQQLLARHDSDSREIARLMSLLPPT